MIKNKKSFVTIFPGYKDFHFFKDPGQIPYRFQKLGYNSKIVCFKNEENYTETIKNVPLALIPRNRFTRKYNLGIVFYLIFNGRSIDILNLFHLKWDSLLLAFFYKFFNPTGFVYLKMDNCHFCGEYPWEIIFSPTDRLKFPIKKKKPIEAAHDFLIRKWFIHKIDLWSIEDEESQKYFEDKYQFFKKKLITIYNGHAVDLNGHSKLCRFSDKEKIILSVSNLGTYQKATEILLEAFQNVQQMCDWNLHLAGSIESKFKQYIHEYFLKYPNLKERIIFHGSLQKDKLYELYNRSGIFCLPSRFEGFAIVYSEAMFFRNPIITTSSTSVRDLINNNKLGIIVEKEDISNLTKAIIELIDNENLRETYANNSKNFADANLNWDNLCTKLNIEINKRME